MNILTLRVQEFGEAQVLLSDVEGLLEVVGGIGPRQLVELYQVRPGGPKMKVQYTGCGNHKKINNI